MVTVREMTLGMSSRRQLDRHRWADLECFRKKTGLGESQVDPLDGLENLKTGHQFGLFSNH